MKLTNNGKAPLGIPGNPLLEPGQSIICLNWDEIQDNKIVQAWLVKRVLTAGEQSPEYQESAAKVPAVEATDDMSRKDELIAQLAELGINRDRRSSVERLESMLAEAISSQESDNG
ncbi:MAG: hypothetical protein CMN85_10600 [Spongiibacteraceae bacterium]|nr:hypothetical protein [Spongiibacteraceae bacterium]|tara:strand:+ start:17954 stop:18301 length:348 start_codon:yes stop_codon:yes gene_type:complete